MPGRRDASPLRQGVSDQRQCPTELVVLAELAPAQIRPPRARSQTNCRQHGLLSASYRSTAPVIPGTPVCAGPGHASCSWPRPRMARPLCIPQVRGSGIIPLAFRATLCRDRPLPRTGFWFLPVDWQTSAGDTVLVSTSFPSALSGHVFGIGASRTPPRVCGFRPSWRAERAS